MSAGLVAALAVALACVAAQAVTVHRLRRQRRDLRALLRTKDLVLESKDRTIATLHRVIDRRGPASPYIRSYRADGVWPARRQESR